MSLNYANVTINPPFRPGDLVFELENILHLTRSMSRNIVGEAHIEVNVAFLSEDEKESLLEMMTDEQIDVGYLDPCTLRIDQH